MKVDDGLKELAQMEYPRKVNVVDAVMAEVGKHPYLRPVHHVQTWQRIVSTTVAAAIALLIVNVVVVRTQTYDEVGIGAMIAQVQNYDCYGSTIEDGAVNPFEYLYGDYED